MPPPPFDVFDYLTLQVERRFNRGTMIVSMLPKISRSCARIICLDSQGRILLLRWRDPFSGRVKWEPPGGGMEPGESPIEAARRELAEETGLSPNVILPPSIEIDRSYEWNGRGVQGREWYFLASVEAKGLNATGMLTSETEQFLGYRWFSAEDLDGFTELVEPPQLDEIIRRLRQSPEISD